MNRTINICDCTLRDGGYYTNWDFNKDLVELYFNTINSIPAITHIEIGYRNLHKDNYFGEFFYCPEYILKKAKKLCPNKEIAVMINEKDVTDKDIDILLTPYRNAIDLIRIAVAPYNIERAAKLSDALKKRGLKVAFNIMYMSRWADDINFIKSFKNLEGRVDYLYMVDSFGSVYPEDVERAMLNYKQYVSIPVGFHGHNNIELGLANTLAALKKGCDIVDVTVTGMGRGAGNLKTELLLTSLNSKGLIIFDFNKLNPLVAEFEKMQRIYHWGTNLPYMISGAFSLPQKDVMSWISKRRYTTDSIINALQNTKNNITDNGEIPVLKNEPGADTVVVVGGGDNARKHAHALELLCVKNPNIVLIHAGGRHVKLFNQLKNRQYYCLLGAEGNKLKEYVLDLDLAHIKCIIEPAPRKMGTILLPEVVNNTFELPEFSFMQNPPDSLLSIAFQLALDLQAKTIYLFGMDGYDIKTDDQMIEVSAENQYLIDKVSEIKNVLSLLPSSYQNLKIHSIYSLL